VLPFLGCGSTRHVSRGSVPATPYGVNTSDTSCSIQSVYVSDGDKYELHVGCRGRVVALVLPESQYKAILEQVEYDGSWADLVSEVVLAQFGDCFDFILVVANEGRPATSVMGRHRLVRNSADGIGRAYSLAPSGRLQSVVFLATRSSLRLGPSLHEIMHRWGNYVLRSVDAKHWGFSSVGGQLGGWSRGTLVSLGDGLYRATVSGRPTFGTYANAGNSVPYGELELYLMGLLPPTETPPILVAKDAAWVDQRTGLFRARGFDVVSVEDIAARYGWRSPAYPEAQSLFRGIVVVISPRQLSTDEWSEISTEVHEFSAPRADSNPHLYNFWEATLGKASIKMDGVEHMRGCAFQCHRSR